MIRHWVGYPDWLTHTPTHSLLTALSSTQRRFSKPCQKKKNGFSKPNLKIGWASLGLRQKSSRYIGCREVHASSSEPTRVWFLITLRSFFTLLADMFSSQLSYIGCYNKCNLNLQLIFGLYTQFKAKKRQHIFRISLCLVSI